MDLHQQVSLIICVQEFLINNLQVFTVILPHVEFLANQFDHKMSLFLLKGIVIMVIRLQNISLQNCKILSVLQI